MQEIWKRSQLPCRKNFPVRPSRQRQCLFWQMSIQNPVCPGKQRRCCCKSPTRMPFRHCGQMRSTNWLNSLSAKNIISMLKICSSRSGPIMRKLRRWLKTIICSAIFTVLKINSSKPQRRMRKPQNAVRDHNLHRPQPDPGEIVSLRLPLPQTTRATSKRRKKSMNSCSTCRISCRNSGS